MCAFYGQPKNFCVKIYLLIACSTGIYAIIVLINALKNKVLTKIHCVFNQATLVCNFELCFLTLYQFLIKIICTNYITLFPILFELYELGLENT